MGYKASTRIAVSHTVLFTLLSYTFILLGCTLEAEDIEHFRIVRRGFFLISFCFIYPLLFSFILLWGIVKKKVVLVRIWLFSTIITTVMLLFLLLSGSIYLSLILDVYWGIILCALPFVLTLWMTEGVIVVFAYYKKLESGTTTTDLA